MQIVLEGPDNAGKTTLAAYLSSTLGIEVHHSGGPSRGPGEINRRTDEYYALEDTMIFDRHPAISQNIYADALQDNRERVTATRIIAFYAKNPFIIYCRNIRGTEGHVLSEHSGGVEHFDRVNRNMERICAFYDKWAIANAAMVYRIGDDMDQVARMVLAALGGNPEVTDVSFNPWQDVLDFHRKFDLIYNGKPRMLPLGLRDFRERFLEEELSEYENAAIDAKGELGIASDEAEFVHHLETQADSLVDLVYVALGTAYLHGFDFPEMWRRVQAANMRKVRARSDGSDSLRKSAIDVVKPPGWEPPKHTDLIEDHAHRDKFRS